MAARYKRKKGRVGGPSFLGAAWSRDDDGRIARLAAQSRKTAGRAPGVDERYRIFKLCEARLRASGAHREFFFVAPHDVKVALIDLQGSVLQFVESPEPLEWHQSQSMRRQQEPPLNGQSL